MGTRRPYLFSFLLICALAWHSASSQLITQGGYTAQQLVQNILLGGGVQAFNFQYSGSPISIGYFNGQNTNIGLPEGVIMTTGVIAGPEGPQGPNTIPNAGIDNNFPGSPLLQQAFGFAQPTFNATILTFSFIPQGDSVAFRYVFGSEEYKEFVGSEFNDVFGFFISGPNPAGPAYVNQNIARIPGSNTPVAINNVNHLTNSAYYVDNELPGFSTIQYDGFTRPLLAWARVIPCETYTIRLAIADVADGIYDSGVFLEAKSFSSRGVDIDYTVLNSPDADTLYEGCGTAKVVIRSTGDNSQARTIFLNLGGTAINGTDITPIPTSINFAAGQDSVVFSFQAMADGLPEGIENIVIQLQDPTLCPNTPLPFITIPVADVQPLNIAPLPDLSFSCNNEIVSLNGNVTGGISPYTFNWTPGNLSGNNQTLLVSQTTQVTLTVSDRCSNTGTESFQITVPNVPPLQVFTTPDTALCPGESVTLNASTVGGIGNVVLSWSNIVGSPPSQVVNPTTSVVISVSATDSCGNTQSASTIISVFAPAAEFEFRYITNSKLAFTPSFSPDVTTWIWDFGDGNFSTEEQPVHLYQDTGLYKVTLVAFNDFGCSDTVIKDVRAYPPYSFYMPNAYTPNSDGLNEVYRGKGQGFISYEMFIFDRWGQEVYRTTDISRGWTGIDDNGRPFPLGVYVYKVTLETPVGDVFEYSGRVSLIR